MCKVSDYMEKVPGFGVPEGFELVDSSDPDAPTFDQFYTEEASKMKAQIDE